MSLLAELKRRNVTRMAGLYLVASWLAVQVSSTILPMFGAPDWLARSIVVLLVIGFVPALVFAWVFELTPDGVKRESQVDRSASVTADTARRMERQILVVFALALAYFAFDKFALAPRREAALVAGATDAARAGAGAGAKQAPSDASIAVLAFADMSAAHDQEYLSDGMAEELLDALAKVPGLKVAGRTSSFYFKGRNEPLEKIGAALGVAHVLEGSVRKQGDRVRITAQLIQARDGFHLWSESYDGDVSDVFKLQETIAAKIVGSLKTMLMPVKFAAAAVAEHAPAAHEQVLRGRYLFRQRGADNLLAAIEAFKSAIAIEPGYADAWSGLAQALVVVPYHPRAGGNATADTQAIYVQAFDAANRALAIDPDSSAALAARANAREARDFDWRGAENDFRAAISADERDVTAHQWYAEMLTAQRRWDESNAQYEIALAIDPLAPVVIFSQGTLLQYRGDAAGALARYDAALKLDPGLQAAQNMKQAALVDLKRYDEALSMAQAWPEPMRSVLAAIVAAKRDPARKPEAIRRILADDLDIIKAGHLASIGAYDLALDELEREFDAQVPLRELTWCQPAFEPLHDNARFKALLKRINLPPESTAASK